MDCPVCSDEPMIVLEHNNIEIDFCQNCQGIWLDQGELELLLGSGPSEDIWAQLNEKVATREQPRRCPHLPEKNEKN